MSAPLAGLCSLWLEKIRKAAEVKDRDFGAQAREAMSFYAPESGNYNFLYQGKKDSPAGVGLAVPEPTFKMTLNKVAELVQIFGPILYHKNPVRRVGPRRRVVYEPAMLASPTLLSAMAPGLDPQLAADPNVGMMLAQSIQQMEVAADQQDKAKSATLEAYLNFTPNELGLKDHAEKAIDEALIKGRGCLWLELYTPPGSQQRYVGSFQDSVDYLFVDPDAESIETAWWIARKCCHPIWEVERKYGLAPGTLKQKGNLESYGQATEVDARGRQFDRQRGLTNDLMCYYEVYSKMGVGGRMAGGDADRLREMGMLPGDLPELRQLLDPLVGDYAYLVIAPGVDFPLNLPPEVMDLPLMDPMTGQPGPGATEVPNRLRWPIPLWADDAWPVSVLDFHHVPGKAWPMSHIKPALGELRALNWLYSFMVGKAQVSLRSLIAVLKELSEEFKVTVLEGADLSVVELDTQNRSIQECVQILQYPQMNADIWLIIQAIEAAFDKRVGLNEIFYGNSQKQLRSATEADLKSQHLNIRPDDMAERVEAWMTAAARKEAIAARLFLRPEDVEPVLGPLGATVWAQMVAVADPILACRELDYRIEAGSARKPNRDREMALANEAMQSIFPVLNQYAAATGAIGPVNAVIAYWARTRDLDPAPFLLPPPPPPAPAPAPADEDGKEGAAEGAEPDGKGQPMGGGGGGMPMEMMR